MGQVPSQFWCGEMLLNQAKCFIIILFTFCQWNSSGSSTHSSGAKYGLPDTLFHVHYQYLESRCWCGQWCGYLAQVVCIQPKSLRGFVLVLVMKSCQDRCSHLTPPTHLTPQSISLSPTPTQPPDSQAPKQKSGLGRSQTRTQNRVRF